MGASNSQALDLMKLFALRAEFGASVNKGQVIFSVGEPAEKFYVVLRGRVRLERSGWDSQVVPPGDLFGEIDVFAGQPRQATATALEHCSLLAFNRDMAVRLAEATPSFALMVIRKSCERVVRAEGLLTNGARPLPAAPAAAVPGVAGVHAPAHRHTAPAGHPARAHEPAAGPPPAGVGGKVGPVVSVDYASAMWKKEVKCPNCRTTFHAWNVRSAAINVATRDSDFMSRYAGVDPNWYAVWVCPSCQLAAYADDFGAMHSAQVARVRPALAEARAADTRQYDFSHYRDADLALRSYQLATAFYEGLRGGAEKAAGLYHRMAWLERQRGNAEQERTWLARARDGYHKAFTHSDSAKQGVLWAYLIGEIDLRLGRHAEALKWFNTASQQPEFKAQPLLEKMVRDRWGEAAELARGAAKPAP